MRIFEGLLGIIGAVCLVVALLAFSVQVPALGLWFYKYEFSKNDTYEYLSMDKEELHHVADGVIRYLGGETDTLTDVTAVVDGTERFFFNQKEVTHMEDVKVLFDLGLKVRNYAVIGFLAVFAYFIISQLIAGGRRPIRYLLGACRNGCIAALAIFGAAGAYVALDFSRGFTMFHEILFSNDLWLLDPRTDLLIRMLPNAFFQDIAILIAVLFAVFLILAAVLTGLLRRRIRRP